VTETSPTPLSLVAALLLAAGGYLAVGLPGATVGAAAGVVRWRADAPLALAAAAVALLAVTDPVAASTAVWDVPVVVPFGPAPAALLAAGATALVVEPAAERPTGRIALGSLAVVVVLGATLGLAGGASLWTATAAASGVVVALTGLLDRSAGVVDGPGRRGDESEGGRAGTGGGE